MVIFKIPGWIDLQVNGYKGVDFSSSDLTIKDIKFINRELLKAGTIGYCPTIISTSVGVYKQNLSLISKVMEMDEKEGANILGVHLEGPFISKKDGVRGIHPKKHIRSPSIEFFRRLSDWANQKILLISLDPALGGALELIKHIKCKTNTVISIGHSLANNNIIDEAIDLGLSAATHVSNGIPSMINRHKNPLWKILADERIFGLFITDGFHLPSEFILVALKAKTPKKFIVTSDMVHLAGCKPGIYNLYDNDVILESNHHLHVKNSPYLAGSASTMNMSMNFLTKATSLDLKNYLQIGYSNPLRLLKKKTDIDQFHTLAKIKYRDKRFIIS
ncbi:MAG: hypothetical protein GF317_08490 [Candidatus Lokiarchaeota archaeon]|nr:hypothetical protein [Candidatus Lokiarchaeota archaeon]MBD3199752.1 hypothetical protein [Candidatus Lokiarchaeota archaeon]